ncbi:MAG: sensor histidine kinase, partial [Acetatifactor sp.]|nr:sensor histidine kinase [Acetatifactor sp.]
DEQKLYTNITNFLNQQYQFDSDMLVTMVYLTDRPEQVYYTYNTYGDNNKGNEGYQRVRYFKEKVQNKLLDSSDALSTEVTLFWQDEHLYMVRNLLDISFHPYGMIVIELYVPEIFNGLESVWGAESYQVYLEDIPILQTEFPSGHKIPSLTSEKCVYLRQSKDEEYPGNYSYFCTSFGDKTLTYGIRINSNYWLDEVKVLNYSMIVVVLFVVPLIFLMFYFFNRQISRPVRDLVAAAGEIASGNYGHQVKTNAMSKEFDYLEKSFNSMSSELKYQFETIYQEELALRDANIKALQSQINPHFLNNTLEIINWEARMSGSDTVSGMIEALGTMLSATMNRKQRRFVSLAEELSYVDAYLYIISKRFGERFQVVREIDESLLQMEVPMLIIQPIVENAVEHGVEANRQGKVTIRITSDWDKIIIEVKNDSALAPKDRERIDLLLNGDGRMEEEHHVSLGIRNVNRRIKIIYGEECGLTIQNDADGCTVSRIVVKMLHEGSVGDK